MAAVNKGATNMKMRALLKGDYVEVKVLISHPMETGRKKDVDSHVLPAHFIQLLTAHVNENKVLEAQWGTGISKNPYLTFRLANVKIGDIVEVTWHDNLGETASHQIAVTQAS